LRWPASVARHVTKATSTLLFHTPSAVPAGAIYRFFRPSPTFWSANEPLSHRNRLIGRQSEGPLAPNRSPLLCRDTATGPDRRGADAVSPGAGVSGFLLLRWEFINEGVGVHGLGYPLDSTRLRKWIWWTIQHSEARCDKLSTFGSRKSPTSSKRSFHSYYSSHLEMPAAI